MTKKRHVVGRGKRRAQIAATRPDAKPEEILFDWWTEARLKRDTTKNPALRQKYYEQADRLQHALEEKRHRVGRGKRASVGGRVEIHGTQSPAYLAGKSDDHTVKWTATVRGPDGEVIDGAAAQYLFEVEDWLKAKHPGLPVTLVRPPPPSWGFVGPRSAT
jgi:hypothetical protein